MRKIRRGDEVIVISGKNKGQRGRVRIVIPDKDSPTGILVQVMDVMRQGGVENVSIAPTGG